MAAYNYEMNDLSAYFTNGSDCANAFWWDFGDGYYSDLENPWHMYDSAGTYQVCLTAIDTGTLRSDTACQVLDLYVGVDEYSSGMVALYPNPCNDRLSLECRGEVRSARLGIYNSLGALVLCEKIQVGNGRRTELNLDLPSGLYLAVGFDDKGTMFSKRLVVSR